MRPGIYQALPMADYLRLQAFSASLVNAIINECPRAAWFDSWLNPNPPPADDSDASDTGSVAHAILLEGSSECVCVIDPMDHPAKTTGAIPNGWTNGSIRAARDAARAAGKIPMLPCDMAPVAAMVDSALVFIESLRDTEPAIWAAFQPDGGQSELTCLWDDGGTLCRMRPDRISNDRRIIVDAKFTKRSAEPDSWGRTQIGPMGYRISASFYRRGAHALFHIDTQYVFLVVEQEPPHLCSLVGVDPTGYAMADEQVAYALKEWRRCVSANHWPAYANRVCYPEVSPWEQARWLEKQGIGADGIPYDISKLFEKRVA